jgi:hypothetical protein
MKIKCLVACLVLCLIVGGTAYAQSDPFNGTWRMNPAKSTSPSGRALPDVEVLVLEIAGHFGSPDHAESGINDITANGRRSRSRYTATYNDGMWHPRRDFETGEETGGHIMMIRMDERSELRLGQESDGSFSSFILRQVSEDGQTLHVMWYDGEGGIIQDLHLDKQ